MNKKVYITMHILKIKKKKKKKKLLINNYSTANINRLGVLTVYIDFVFLNDVYLHTHYL